MFIQSSWEPWKKIWVCDYDHCSDWFITHASYASHLRTHYKVVCLFCHKEMSLAKNHFHSRFLCAREQVVTSNREKQEVSCPQ